MSKGIKIGLIVLVVVLILIVYVYQTQSRIEITGEQKTEVLQYANPITDNLLDGFNEGNYTMLSRDFDEQMKNAFTENVFLQNRELIISKIGLYVSKEMPKVLKQGPFIVVIYSAEFEKESGVEVRVVFLKYDEKNFVSGLWFNSPKLRE